MRPTMQADGSTLPPPDPLDAPCLCGHIWGEHLPKEVHPRQICFWSRQRGYDGPTELETTAPCNCAGFAPRLRVVG